MSPDLMHHILSILIQALVILTLEITLIIVGLRFGWFLWVIKTLITLRHKILAKRTREEEKA